MPKSSRRVTISARLAVVVVTLCYAAQAGGTDKPDLLRSHLQTTASVWNVNLPLGAPSDLTPGERFVVEQLIIQSLDGVFEAKQVSVDQHFDVDIDLVLTTSEGEGLQKAFDEAIGNGLVRVTWKPDPKDVVGFANDNTGFGTPLSLRHEFVTGESVALGDIWSAIMDEAHKTGLDLDHDSIKAPSKQGSFTVNSHWCQVNTKSKSFEGCAVSERYEIALWATDANFKPVPLAVKTDKASGFWFSVEYAVRIRRKSSSEGRIVRAAQPADDEKVIKGDYHGIASGARGRADYTWLTYGARPADRVFNAIRKRLIGGPD